MEEIIKTYENHQSIKLIKNNVPSENKEFTIEPATVVEVNKTFKHFNPKKTTGLDKILVKIVKLEVNIIRSHFIINNDLSRNSFFHSPKVASVRPIFKRR